jgi:hypothetical protein
MCDAHPSLYDESCAQTQCHRTQGLRPSLHDVRCLNMYRHTDAIQTQSDLSVISGSTPLALLAKNVREPVRRTVSWTICSVLSPSDTVLRNVS